MAVDDVGNSDEDFEEVRPQESLVIPHVINTFSFKRRLRPARPGVPRRHWRS